jgi:glutamine synthetase
VVAGALVVPQVDRFKILNERESHARFEVFLENYNKTINIEGQLMVLMANRYILPAAYKYLRQVAESVAAVKAAGAASKEAKKTLDQIVKLTDEFKQKADKLQELLEHEGGGGADKHAKFFRDKVVPAMESLRETGDSLESIVPHDTWPLPTYREMLFIK